HAFATAGQFTVTATLRNEDGTFAAPPVDVSVAAARLTVTDTAIVGGALHVDFNLLLDQAAGAAGTVSLTGALSGPIATTLTFDADGSGIVLTRADGRPLQYDDYELVLTDSGFASVSGSVLDGDANGVAGGDFATSITYSASTVGVAGLPDFMRGPGEHVDVPSESEAGLQVRFTSQGGVRTMTFTVAWDPALLRVDGVLPGTGLPAGAQIDWTIEDAPGGQMLARITIVSDTPIAAGQQAIVSLDATVPDTAPYGSSEILTVSVEMINNAAPAATQDEEALHLVGYYGDTDADRQLTLMDLWLTTRVALGIDSEFRDWAG